MIKSKVNTNEPVSKYFPLAAGFEIKEGENFNHRCSVVNALGVNTCSISRIKN